MTPEYRKYLKSTEWAEVKNDLFANRGRKCQRCGSGKKLHVHHNNYKNIFNEEPTDLEILCSKCHVKEHSKKPEKKPLSLAQKVMLKKRRKKGVKRG